LLADAAGDGRAVLVEGDLARYVDLVRGFDGLGLCGGGRERLEREMEVEGGRAYVGSCCCGGGLVVVVCLFVGVVFVLEGVGWGLTRASFLGGYEGEVGHCSWRGGEGS